MANALARPAKTTVTSFRVIEVLKTHDQAGVTTIAKELGLSKGAVHKHLTTLETIGYVIKEDRKYRLGLGFLDLGAAVRRRLDIYTVGKSVIEQLSKATEEVASLVILEQEYARYMYRVPYNDEIKLPHYEGERIYLHASAGGKAILAYLSHEQRESILDNRGTPKVTARTITTREKLDAELRNVRDTHTAHDHGEQNEGWQSVASPITDAEDQAIGAVTVSSQSELARRQDIPGLVISTASAIENKLQTT